MATSTGNVSPPLRTAVSSKRRFITVASPVLRYPVSASWYAPLVGRDNQIGELVADRLGGRIAERRSAGGIELDDTPGLVHQNDAVQRHVENRVVARLAVSRVDLRLLAGPDLLLERRRPVGRFAQVHRAPQAGDDEKDVFEDDPGRVLEPAPLAGDHHAIDRLRPKSRAASDPARRPPSQERGRASHGRTPETPASRTRESAFRCGRR